MVAAISNVTDAMQVLVAEFMVIIKKRGEKVETFQNILLLTMCVRNENHFQLRRVMLGRQLVQ